MEYQYARVPHVTLHSAPLRLRTLLAFFVFFKNIFRSYFSIINCIVLRLLRNISYPLCPGKVSIKLMLVVLGSESFRTLISIFLIFLSVHPKHRFIGALFLRLTFNLLFLKLSHLIFICNKNIWPALLWLQNRQDLWVLFNRSVHLLIYPTFVFRLFPGLWVPFFNVGHRNYFFFWLRSFVIDGVSIQPPFSLYSGLLNVPKVLLPVGLWIVLFLFFLAPLQSILLLIFRL